MNVLDQPLRRVVALAVLSLAVAAPTSASGHPRVDAGLARLNEADFRGAIAAFEDAEAAEDLTLADLESLLEGRAMAALALGDEAAVTEAFSRLAAIDPEHRFTAAAPPEIRAQFERVRTAQPRLGLELRSTRGVDAVRLETVIAGDPGGLVRAVRLSARVDGGPWRQWNDRRARVPANPEQTVEAFATAHGPGGAPVAAAGSEAEPVRVAPTELVPHEGGGDRERERSGGGGAWVWIGAGAALVTAAVVLTVVAVSSSGQSDRTQPGIPEVL